MQSFAFSARHQNGGGGNLARAYNAFSSVGGLEGRWAGNFKCAPPITVAISKNLTGAPPCASHYPPRLCLFLFPALSMPNGDISLLSGIFPLQFKYLIELNLCAN